VSVAEPQAHYWMIAPSRCHFCQSHLDYSYTKNGTAGEVLVKNNIIRERYNIMGSSLRASHEEDINNVNNVVSRVIFTTFSVLLLLTILSTLALMSTHVSADPISTTSSATASVNVSAACTMSASIATGEEHTKTINAGTFTGDIGLTTISTICNDNGGYAIYAIGYSNDSYVDTDLGRHTDLIYSNSTAGATTNNIATGTAQTGNTSSWSMKLAAIGTAAQSTTPTIAGSASDPSKQTGDTDYSNYAAVPTTFTKVAYLPNSTMDPDDPTTSSTTSSLTTTYGVYAHPAQAAGTYAGKVRYTLVHPNMNNDANAPNLNLYDTVAAMSKGKQNADDLRKEIVTPTQETPVSTNSGVYEYNADEFGVASDANNNYKIYYYRGVLDTYEGLGTYGSDGQADAYPNYVKLGNNTCWRIVRTTGSGGVKMIYNGTWTGSSCANATTAARTDGFRFNDSSVTINDVTYYGLNDYNMHAIGYTYSNIPAGTTAETTLSALFGSSGNDFTTNINDSTIKQYIEKDWYKNSMTDFTDILEPSAGYCNDRSTYSFRSIFYPEDTEVIPYNTSGAIGYYYGTMIRDLDANVTYSLSCSRGATDIYSFNNAIGNRQLSYPVALLTADESSFSGSSGYNAGWAFHENSFLNSGDGYWLLSPCFRHAGDGIAYEFFLNAEGKLSCGRTTNSSRYGRPVVSLIQSTTIVGGSGTATDPWLINE